MINKKTPLITATIISLSLYGLNVQADVFDVLWKYSQQEKIAKVKKETSQKIVSNMFLANKACNTLVDKDFKKFNRQAGKILKGLKTAEQKIKYTKIVLTAKNKYLKRKALVYVL